MVQSSETEPSQEKYHGSNSQGIKTSLEIESSILFFLSAFPKSCLDLKRAAKYWFDEIERHQRGNKKLTRSENDLGGKIVTQIGIEHWILVMRGRKTQQRK